MLYSKLFYAESVMPPSPSPLRSSRVFFIILIIGYVLCIAVKPLRVIVGIMAFIFLVAGIFICLDEYGSSSRATGRRDRRFRRRRWHLTPQPPSPDGGLFLFYTICFCFEYMNNVGDLKVALSQHLFKRNNRRDKSPTRNKLSSCVCLR